MSYPSYFHPLPADILQQYAQDIPHLFTFPFHYVPHPLCTAAAKLVREQVKSHPEMLSEAEEGKMFGVLIVDVSTGKDASRKIGFIASYSAQLAGSYDWPWFVPPIFDILKPGGHFVDEEHRISLLSQRILEMETSAEFRLLKETVNRFREDSEKHLADFRTQMAEAKRKRDAKRHNATPEELQEMLPSLIHESQQQKADYKRLQRKLADERKHYEEKMAEHDKEITLLRRERQKRSVALQQWIFEQYVVNNAHGASTTLMEIFNNSLPPSGAGECCAPKLLQCAYRNHWRPLCMAEFWMGQSPKEELRQDGHYYPACRSKCRPILHFMLQGLDVEPNPVLERNRLMANRLKVIYEDSDIVVVNKPSGMLSVPGNDEVPSVKDVVQKRFPHAKGPLIVHRLDMDTSGIMVVALHIRAYHILQRQFESHKVLKRYEAIVAGDIRGEGDIDLPLAPNPYDRPRQMVSETHGRDALTHYQVAGHPKEGTTRLMLWPRTGRTHQLRVHCAHPQGLHCPIVGDALYGTASERLMLHAAEICFVHPDGKHRMHFVVPPEF